MSFHLKPREPVDDGLRRIAHDQIDRARAELTDDTLEAARAVHQARKRLKKIRALLRLARPVMGKGRYRRENRAHRDLGRRLAGPRDAEVMVETLEALQQDDAANGSPLPFATLHQYLTARRDAYAREDDGALRHRMAEVANALAAARESVADWPLEAEGFDLPGPGLKRSYKRGRKALGKVMKNPSDGRFHETRKRVKDHWYHTRLLKKTWTGVMGCWADALKDLSDLLGDDHDLAVFRATLQDVPEDVIGGDEFERLCRLVAERQKVLRRRAIPLACRVYAEKPGHLHKRIGAYWETWWGW